MGQEITLKVSPNDPVQTEQTEQQTEEDQVKNDSHVFFNASEKQVEPESNKSKKK